MALLRNPAAPFLTICAYANLKSQIFLTSSDAWSRNSQSKSSSASVFFVPYIQTEKQTLSVLPSKCTSYLSVPPRVHRRRPCPRTWNARPRPQDHIPTVATAAPPSRHRDAAPTFTRPRGGFRRSRRSACSRGEPAPGGSSRLPGLIFEGPHLVLVDTTHTFPLSTP